MIADAVVKAGSSRLLFSDLNKEIGGCLIANRFQDKTSSGTDMLCAIF